MSPQRLFFALLSADFAAIPAAVIVEVSETTTQLPQLTKGSGVVAILANGNAQPGLRLGPCPCGVTAPSKVRAAAHTTSANRFFSVLTESPPAGECPHR